MTEWTWPPALCSPAFIIASSVLVRLMIGLSSYSGAAHPPRYGDYEAQRHWMELTVHLPEKHSTTISSPQGWHIMPGYKDSPHNNASWWPVDYPPLSGYQSWVCGKVLQLVEPEAVALGSSRGYETPSSKLAMRLTVVVADLLVYIPACVWAVQVLYRTSTTSARALALASALLQPALLVIDHGHFQYNGISLGLTVAAVAAIASNRQMLGSVFFCLALNHKQMALFYAPAFFAHLLGWALQHRTVQAKVVAVVRLGMVVIATFAVCWAPYLTSAKDALQVLHRIFPVKRGLFEDYLSNFWCTTSLLVKWKLVLPAELLLRLSAGITLAVAAPAMLQQMLRPSARGLLLCMANSAFAFYMFGYQVHEKSILLPLLPVTLLAPSDPTLAALLPLIATFSMFPLLQRDGLTLPYLALAMMWIGALWPACMARARTHAAACGENSSGHGSGTWLNTIQLSGGSQSAAGLGSGPAFGSGLGSGSGSKRVAGGSGGTLASLGSAMSWRGWPRPEETVVNVQGQTSGGATAAGGGKGSSWGSQSTVTTQSVSPGLSSDRVGRSGGRNKRSQIAQAWHACGDLLVRWMDVIGLLAVVVVVVVHTVRLLVPPPQHLPWLHDRLHVTTAFVALLPIVWLLQVRQWGQGWGRAGNAKVE